MTSQEFNWSAGFLEGEGSFSYAAKSGTVYVRASQKQKEPLERLQRYFGGCLFEYKMAARPDDTYWQWALATTKAIPLMLCLYAIMSPARQAQIKKVLEARFSRPRTIGFYIRKPNQV